MRFPRFLIIILIILTGIIGGCSGGSDSGPTLPSPGGPQGGDFQGDQPEPPIPTPFLRLADAFIYDMEWEADGDLVAATDEGAFLFTPYGVFKRSLGGGEVLAVTNNDTGRGMSYMPETGNPDGWWDDEYVSGGHFTTHFDDLWYSGDPNPT